MTQTSSAKPAKSNRGKAPQPQGAEAPTKAPPKAGEQVGREVVVFCGAELAAARSAFDRAVAGGLVPAVPATTGSIRTLDDWHDRLLSGIEDSVDPIAPGKPWQLSASEIFLANWSQPRWGWMLTRLERLAEFWLGFDEAIRIVLVRSSLSGFVSRQIRSVTSMPELEARIWDWRRFEAFAAALLETYADRVTAQSAEDLPIDQGSGLAAFLGGLIVSRYGMGEEAERGSPPSRDASTAFRTAVDEFLRLQHADSQRAELNSSLAAALDAADAASTSNRALDAEIAEGRQQIRHLLEELAARSEVLRWTSIQRKDLEKEQRRLQASLLEAQAELERLSSQAKSVPAAAPATAPAPPPATAASPADEQLLAQLRSDLESTRLQLFDAQAALQALFMTGPAAPSAATTVVAVPGDPTALSDEPASPGDPNAETRRDEPVERPHRMQPAVEAPDPEPAVTHPSVTVPLPSPAPEEIAFAAPSGPGLACSRIIAQPCKPNSEYEALDVFCSDASFEDYRWPSLAFRIGAAAVDAAEFSIHPRIEISQQGPGKPFDTWVPETDTELGATFELRFQTDIKALDLDVWRALAPKDQALMITLLSTAVAATRRATSWPARQRDKEQWLDLLHGMAATFRARLRGSRLLQHLVD